MIFLSLPFQTVSPFQEITYPQSNYIRQDNQGIILGINSTALAMDPTVPTPPPPELFSNDVVIANPLSSVSGMNPASNILSSTDVSCPVHTFNKSQADIMGSRTSLNHQQLIQQHQEHQKALLERHKHQKIFIPTHYPTYHRRSSSQRTPVSSFQRPAPRDLNTIDRIPSNSSFNLEMSKGKSQSTTQLFSQIPSPTNFTNLTVLDHSDLPAAMGLNSSPPSFGQSVAEKLPCSSSKSNLGTTDSDFGSKGKIKASPPHAAKDVCLETPDEAKGRRRGSYHKSQALKSNSATKDNLQSIGPEKFKHNTLERKINEPSNRDCNYSKEIQNDKC